MQVTYHLLAPCKESIKNTDLSISNVSSQTYSHRYNGLNIIDQQFLFCFMLSVFLATWLLEWERGINTMVKKSHFLKQQKNNLVIKQTVFKWSFKQLIVIVRNNSLKNVTVNKNSPYCSDYNQQKYPMKSGGTVLANIRKFTIWRFL